MVQRKGIGSFYMIAKPRGAVCNLDCKYCYYLSKQKLYPTSDSQMPENLLELYTRQYIEAQKAAAVTFVWHGGEPTLMGLGFFRQAITYQKKYCKPDMRVYNSLQTNGVTLDDEWCHFFSEHNFLIGISLDGPRELHDFYRVDKGERPTFDHVMNGLRLLQKHHVEYNVLTTVHARNADYPIEVYQFLRDEAGARFLQFIPVVEWQPAAGYPEEIIVSERSVTAEKYGEFLIKIFNEWAHSDVGYVSIQIFDVARVVWAGGRSGLCIFEETCGTAPVLEHNGDVYSCDHFVEPEYLIGNIIDIPLAEIVNSDQQRAFGLAKWDTLPQYCRTCEVRRMCNGGCPKNRFIKTPDGEPGLNYLCAGYKAFFTYIRDAMQVNTFPEWFLDH